MTELPIDSLLASLTQAVRKHLNVVLTATPGAGKTTRLPPELLAAVEGRILVLEPRRMAAVAACARACEERNWQVGREAGYQVRFESRISRETRLVYMTDALLLRRMIDDPELKDVGLVIIDEFHERNLNQDLILGAIRELQELGRELKLLVMSATLDTERLAKFLNSAHVVDVAGQVHPLEIRHSQHSLSVRTDSSFFERVVEATCGLAAETDGDVLVFLPGVGEITKIEELLARKTSRQIASLHGSLPLADQQRVLGAPTRPRIILSTNVAEASVTVQGVDRVLDSGLAKVQELNTRTGFSALELKRISLFNARQRAGRAARQRPGVCLRLWTEHEEVTQALEPVPECRRVDLSAALLWLAHLGVSQFGDFSWYDRPQPVTLDWARRSLVALGALDANMLLTDMGKRLLRYPLPPRLAALMELGERMGVGTSAAQMAAILAERDFAEKMETVSHFECDLQLRLELLEEGRGRAVQSVREASQQLSKLVQPGLADDQQRRRLLLYSHLDRLCRRREKSDRALMVGGRGVRLQPRSQVRQSDFFVALQGVDLPGQADTAISMASGFSKDFILQELKEQIRVREDIHFDEQRGQFYARRVRHFEDLDLDEPVLTAIDPDSIGDRLVDLLIGRWTWLLQQHAGLGAWMQRLRFLAKHEESVQELVGEKFVREFLTAAAFGKTGLTQILDQDLVGLWESMLDKKVVSLLREQAPTHFLAPSGFEHRILYEESGAFVEVRLQEMFGLQTTPRVAFQKVPLTFRLLGPNYRPVQVTSDMAGFWRAAYIEVRKELRARYPKHSWPEDPLSAKPEAKGRRRT